MTAMYCSAATVTFVTHFFSPLSLYTLGAVIMEGYYMLFDRENSSIYIAGTTCQPRAANSKLSKISGYHDRAVDLVTLDKCYYTPEATLTLPTYAVVLIIVGSFVGIVLVILFVRRISQRRSKRRRQANDGDFHDLVNQSCYDDEE